MSDQHVLPERVPPTAVDARQALRFLARKGAYAVPHPGADGFAVRLDTASPEVLAFIPAPIVAQASGRGWLERDRQGNVRLATAGLKALRKVLSQSAASPHPAKRTRQQGKASKASTPKSPARTLHEAPLGLAASAQGQGWSAAHQRGAVRGGRASGGRLSPRPDQPPRDLGLVRRGSLARIAPRST